MNIENGPPIQALRFTRGAYLNSPARLVAFVLPSGKKIIPSDSGPHVFRHVSGNRLGLKLTGRNIEILSGDEPCGIELQYEQ